jgi:hypothetical protein
MTLFESFVGIIGKNLIHFDDLSTTVLLQSSESVVSCVMNETISNVQHATDLYKEVIQQFLLVMFSQFRKDLLDSFSVVKTMAHRKQIQTKKKKLALATKSVSFQTLLDDKTSRKEMSHSLLKGMLLSNSDVVAVMNKKQIALICKAYNISIKSADKKSDLAEKVKTAIVNSTCMPNYTVLASEQEASTSATRSETEHAVPVMTGIQHASTSTAELQPSLSRTSTEEVGGGTEEQPGLEDSEVCQKCNKIGKDGVEWIQCSSCMKWYHRNCAGLRSKKKWDTFSAEGVDFYCQGCT